MKFYWMIEYYPDFNNFFFLFFSKQSLPRANSQFYRVNFDNSTQNTVVEINSIVSNNECNTAIDMNSVVS